MFVSLPSSAVFFRDVQFVLAQVPNQLGHFFWMALIAVFPSVWFESYWVAVLLFGVELMSFNLHAGWHHKGESWLEHSLWGWLGVAIWSVALVAAVLEASLLPITYYLLIAGTQVASYAIHRWFHRAPDELWPRPWPPGRCVHQIIFGLAVAYTAIIYL